MFHAMECHVLAQHCECQPHGCVGINNLHNSEILLCILEFMIMKAM